MNPVLRYALVVIGMALAVGGLGAMVTGEVVLGITLMVIGLIVLATGPEGPDADSKEL